GRQAEAHATGGAVAPQGSCGGISTVELATAMVTGPNVPGDDAKRLLPPVLRDRGLDLPVAQDVIRPLRQPEDVPYQPLLRLDAPLLEPEHHVALARHEADLDRLVLAKPSRGHARVHAIGEVLVALVDRLDHRRRVHPGGGAEGV